MNKLIVVLIIFIGFCKATDVLIDDEINNETNNKKENTLDNMFSPAKIERNSFDSMIIGYQGLYKEYNGHKEWQYGIFFSLETGWSYLQNILLFGISIDGTAGGFYSLNGNLKLGARVFDGRLIPSIGLGYGLVNHIVDNVQYNAHGSIASFALFIDIGHGVGLEFSYRLAPYPFMGSKNIKISRIESFMVNIKFIHF